MELSSAMYLSNSVRVKLSPNHAEIHLPFGSATTPIPWSRAWA